MSQLDNAQLSLFELKEKAKWSSHNQEKKLAITGMLFHGAEALSSLEEIFNVSVYEDIRSACVDAIRSITEGSTSTSSPMDLQISENVYGDTLDLSLPKAGGTKKKQMDEAGERLLASEKLADLPP